MKRNDIIMSTMVAINMLVKDAYFERNSNPHKFKLRNHYISEALGLYCSLCILKAYPPDTLDWLRTAIQDYDIYTVQHIMNSEKISSYNTRSKVGTDND